MAIRCGATLKTLPTMSLNTPTYSYACDTQHSTDCGASPHGDET